MLRRALVAGLATLTMRGASVPPPASELVRYLDDASFRRTVLERSLPDRSNHYARTRLAHYATATRGDWEREPVWNPRTVPLELRDIGAASDAVIDRAVDPRARPLEIPAEAARGSLEALRALGETAFFRYPAQLAPFMRATIRSRERVTSQGLWLDERHGVGGLVRVELADGSREIAMTCATCHADARDGAQLLIGSGSDRLDVGRAIVEGSPRIESEIAGALLAWGPGRVDVTTHEGFEPVRIPDLRPTRWLTHLHRTASFEQQSMISLAIRIETLLITAHSGVVRPPREVALGLAAYLWSLSAALPDYAPVSAAEINGRALFGARCMGCHREPGFTGAPVALDVIETEPSLGRSAERGTGHYRVPSLRGVSTRGALFHDGTARDVDAVLDPARLDAAYRGGVHGSGAVAGHTFGLDLDPAARADIAAWLRTL